MGGIWSRGVKPKSIKHNQPPTNAGHLKLLFGSHMLENLLSEKWKNRKEALQLMNEHVEETGPVAMAVAMAVAWWWCLTLA